MATVTAFTAERMQEIEDETITDADVVEGDLIFTRHDGSTFNAGSVIGPTGPTGPASVQHVTHATRPGSPAADDMIWETDTKRLFYYTGAAWKWICGNPMRAKANLDTHQSVPDSTITPIEFTDQEYDTDGIWSPGSPDEFTVPAEGDGLWQVTGIAQWGPGTVGVRVFALYKNGDAIASLNGPGAAAWLTGGTLTVDIEAVAGDVFQIVGYQTSGGALNINVTYPVSLSVRKLT